MDNLTAVTLVVSTIITILCIERMMGVFYEKRRTSVRFMFLSYLFYCAVTLLYTLLFPSLPFGDIDMWAVFTSMVLTFVGYFVITLNYESSVGKRFVVIVAIYMVFSMVSIPLVLIIDYFSAPTLYLVDGEVASMLHFLLIPAFTYFTAALLRRFKNVRKNAIMPSGVIIAVIILFVAVWFVPITYGLGMDNIFYEATLIIVTVLFVGSVFLIFYFFDTLTVKYEDKLKSEYQAQEKEYYFAQCQLMQESAEQVKSIRHDIKMHLAALKDIADNGNSEDVRSYLNSLVNDIEKSDIYSNTGNIAFDSIVNYKLRNAKSDNIKLDLRVAVPPEINIEMVDIIIVLGNLLDNALDAVAKVNDKMIKLDIEFIKDALFVKVDNSFNGEILYWEESDGEERKMASLKAGGEHGYGLKNIMQSIEKYNGYMKTSYTDNIFSVGIFLYSGDLEVALYENNA